MVLTFASTSTSPMPRRRPAPATAPAASAVAVAAALPPPPPPPPLPPPPPPLLLLPAPRAVSAPPGSEAPAAAAAEVAPMYSVEAAALMALSRAALISSAEITSSVGTAWSMSIDVSCPIRYPSRLPWCNQNGRKSSTPAVRSICPPPSSGNADPGLGSRTNLTVERRALATPRRESATAPNQPPACRTSSVAPSGKASSHPIGGAGGTARTKPGGTTTSYASSFGVPRTDASSAASCGTRNGSGSGKMRTW